MNTSRAALLPHVRPVQPRRFPAEEPESEKMGQSTRHVMLCMGLYQLLAQVCGLGSTLGADNFVYFDAANPRRCLAPDAFIKLNVPRHPFDSYLVWEEGTPEVAFEVLSPSDTPERWTFEEKLRRYETLGVRELVVFNVDAKPGKRLRVWDRIDHDFVERVVEGDMTPCLTLDVMMFVGPMSVVSGEELPLALRIARDVEGHDRVLTDLEGRERAEQERREAEAKHREAEAKRREAERRVAELEERIAELERGR